MSLINWIHNLNHSNLFHHTFGQANGELATFPQWNHCCGRAGTWRWTGQFGDQVTSIGPIVFDKLVESGEHFLCPHVVVRRGGTLFDQIVFHLVVLLVPDGTNETWLAHTLNVRYCPDQPGQCLHWNWIPLWMLQLFGYYLSNSMRTLFMEPLYKIDMPIDWLLPAPGQSIGTCLNQLFNTANRSFSVRPVGWGRGGNTEMWSICILIAFNMPAGCWCWVNVVDGRVHSLSPFPSLVDQWPIIIEVFTIKQPNPNHFLCVQCIACGQNECVRPAYTHFLDSKLKV